MFSLFAEHPGHHLLSNIAYPDNGKVGVLRTAGIYGANASGKSNLLAALRALDYLVNNFGRSKSGVGIRFYEPYKLSSETKGAPVSFEMEFFAPDDVRYNYAVSFDKDRIVDEKLVSYASGQPALMFHRRPEDTWETIKFGTTYKGGKKRFGFHPYQTYLSIAGDSPEAPASVRAVFDFFQKNLIIANGLPEFLINWREDEKLVHFAGVLLTAADTGIAEIGVKEIDLSNVRIPTGIPAEIADKLRQQLKREIVFFHKTSENQNAEFDIQNESAGTKRLLDLAPIIAAAFEKGGVVVLDELENRMHPFLAEVVIKLFNDPEVNTNGGQLIFSTHNAHVMSPDYMRRDQIWFAEKVNGASRYYSLDEFDKNVVKPTSPFNRWYLEGRFDAVPQIDYNRIAESLVSLRKKNAEE